MIPGNKAILPILWSLFPHHRYLLDTDFTVNDELVKTGYAVKPIAGRCGSNIDWSAIMKRCLIRPVVNLPNRKIFTSNCGVCRKWTVNTFRYVPSPLAATTVGRVCAVMNHWSSKKESDIEPLIVVKK